MARLKLKLQLYCGDEIAMGPGKADLLEAIAREGSISGAGRAMGMSYRRAWLLVDVMNRCFVKPLVETHPGGGKQAGAKLTVEVAAQRPEGACQGAISTLHWVVRRFRLSNTVGVSSSAIVSVTSSRGSI